MTIICAASRAGEVWVGSDRQATAGNLISSVPGKWILWGEWAVGVAGNMRTLNVIDANQKRLFDDLQTAFEFTERMRALVSDFGFDLRPEADDSAPSFRQEMILAHSGGEIWSVCSALSVFNERDFCAAGSGAAFAFGASHVLPEKSRAEDLVRASIGAACQFDIYSGGGPFVQKLERANGPS